MGVHKGTEVRPEYSFGGYKMRVHEWADFLGVKYATLYARIQRNGIKAIEIYYSEEFENARQRQ